jgi:hypothetical protein
MKNTVVYCSTKEDFKSLMIVYNKVNWFSYSMESPQHRGYVSDVYVEFNNRFEIYFSDDKDLDKKEDCITPQEAEEILKRKFPDRFKYNIPDFIKDHVAYKKDSFGHIIRLCPFCHKPSKFEKLYNPTGIKRWLKFLQTKDEKCLHRCLSCNNNTNRIILTFVKEDEELKDCYHECFTIS